MLNLTTIKLYQSLGFLLLLLVIYLLSTATAFASYFTVVNEAPFLDDFDNANIAISSHPNVSWTKQIVAGSQVTEAGGALILKASSNNSSPTNPSVRIISNGLTDFSFLRRRLEYSVRNLVFTSTPNVANSQIVARFGITSSLASTWAAEDAISLALKPNGEVSLAHKLNQPSMTVSNAVWPNKAICSISAQANGIVPTGFDLRLDIKKFELTVYYSDGVDRVCTNATAPESKLHSINWWHWGVDDSGTPNPNNRKDDGKYAHIMLEAQRVGNVPDPLNDYAQVDWGSLKITVLYDNISKTNISLAADTLAPIVFSPVADGLNIDNFSIDDNNEQLYLDLGILDVTKAPFNAKGNNVNDDTEALQNALDFARKHHLVTFLPEGTYLISDTLTCTQGNYNRTTNAISSDAQGPCLLMGSRLGNKPIIRLADNSPGFDTDKYIIHYSARSANGNAQPQPNVSMLQRIENIRIESGTGNPGAIAIYHRAAQGSVIQNVEIDVTGSKTGIQDGIGSGGSITGVHIEGGDYGLDLLKAQPNPTLTDIKLTGQRKNAIVYVGAESLSAVAINITVPTGVTGPAILVVTKDSNVLSWQGQISLVDSIIDFESYTPGNVAIQTNRALFMSDVYIRNTDSTLVSATNEVLNGHSLIGQWQHVVELAQVAGPISYNVKIEADQFQSYDYWFPLYVNGIRESTLNSIHVYPESSIVEPPADLLTQHQFATNFPHWEQAGIVNVKIDSGAAGDGCKDDYQAIQNAINNNNVVLLPKGYYRISQPLVLKANTYLIGISPNLSVILPALGIGCEPPVENVYTDSDLTPLPVVTTENSATGNTIAANFGIMVPLESSDVFALEWKVGRNSTMRDLYMHSQPQFGYNFAGHPELPDIKDNLGVDAAMVQIRGNGGGAWYNFRTGGGLNQGINSRRLLIENTTEPFRCYQCNAEGGKGATNIEVVNAQDIRFYGIKGEGNNPILTITNSNNIDVFGYGGNGSAYPYNYNNDNGNFSCPTCNGTTYTPSLFRIENSRNIRLVNLVDIPRATGGTETSGPGIGINPELWHMVSELDAGGVETTLTLPDPENSPGGIGNVTDPIDRPVAYLVVDDTDADGLHDRIDNCPDMANPNQLDDDSDGVGNACDLDDDNDGLTNSLEISIGTNPLLADTDGDGVSDYIEVSYDGDPTSYNPLTDSNPLSTDTDGDGIWDDSDLSPLSDGDLAPLGSLDGTVNTGDLVIMLRIVLGLKTATSLELEHGDLYPSGAPDGRINLSDLLLMHQLLEM